MVRMLRLHNEKNGQMNLLKIDLMRGEITSLKEFTNLEREEYCILLKIS